MVSDCLDNLVDWCQSNGFELSSLVRLDNVDPSRGRGMVAVEDIPAGTQLFRVPDDCRILPVEKLERATPIEGTTIALCLERAKGDRSKFKPYIKFLDEINFDVLHLPVLWTKQELEDLRGSSFRGFSARKNLEKRFTDLWKEQIAKLGLDMEFEEWLKLLCTVQAYGFADGESDRVAMTPLADVLNASVTLNNARLFTLPIDDADGATELVMEAIKDISKGEEVFNTFGDRSNRELLHLYGFVESPDFGFAWNPYEEIEIAGSHVLEVTEELLKEQTEPITIEGRSMSRRDFLREFCEFKEMREICYPFNLQKSGLRALRSVVSLFRATVCPPRIIQEFLEGEERGEGEIQEHLSMFFSTSIGEEEEKEVLKALDGIADSIEGKYGAILEEDEKLLAEGAQLPTRKKLALVVRIGEIRLLKVMKEKARNLDDLSDDEEDENYSEDGDEDQNSGEDEEDEEEELHGSDDEVNG